jgi:hypothetical protein
MTVTVNQIELNPDSELYQAASMNLQKRGVDVTADTVRVAVKNAFIVANYLSGMLALNGALQVRFVESGIEPVEHNVNGTMRVLAVELLRLGLVDQDFPVL